MLLIKLLALLLAAVSTYFIPVKMERTPPAPPETATTHPLSPTDDVYPDLVMQCRDEWCSDGYYEYLAKGGGVVPLPKTVQETLDHTDPGGFITSWSFSPSGQKLFYLDPNNNALKLFDVKTKRSFPISTLRTNLEDTETFGTEFFGWNDDGTKVGIAMWSDDAEITTEKEVMILEIENDKLVQESFYRLPILFRCPGNFCELRVAWENLDTLIYQPQDSPWAIDFDTFDECRATANCPKTYDLK